MAEIAGILHGFLTYVDIEEDTYDYVHKCADYAGQHVLSQLASFSDNEKEMISDGEFFYAPTDPAGPEGDCLKKRYHPKATYRNGGGQEGYRKRKVPVCTLAGQKYGKKKGTEEKKWSSVPLQSENMGGKRVQKGKSACLYPCGAKIWEEKGYRSRKVPVCTLAQLSRLRSFRQIHDTFCARLYLHSDAKRDVMPLMESRVDDLIR